MVFSLRTLCWLFCCPPCNIVASMAFFPPVPTYSFDTDPTGATDLHLNLIGNKQAKLDAVTVFKTRSIRGNQVGCMFIRCAPRSQYTLLYSHSNAVDLGDMYSHYKDLGSSINCNVFAYDYSGYGVSSGRPSEKNLCADIEAAWQALRHSYGVTPENIILYGESIGTVPTVDLAARYKCAGVILHAPLMSGLRVVCPNARETCCFDIFRCCCDVFSSIDKLSKVESPVLVIHGTEDKMIDFSHGLAMFERCPHPVKPLFVKGAGHNNIGHSQQHRYEYLKRLKQFISSELSTSPEGMRVGDVGVSATPTSPARGLHFKTIKTSHHAPPDRAVTPPH